MNPLEYALCPRCLRAVPRSTGERHCLNDGARLVAACPACAAGIPSPYARFCGRCGAALFAPDGGQAREHHPT
jgi:hypothetical protein